MCELKYRVDTLSNVLLQVDKTKPLAFDVETDGFYGKILLAQFYQASWPEVLIVKQPDVVVLAGSLKKQHIICHNANYEVSTIQTQMGKVVGVPLYHWQPDKWDDTLLLAKMRYFEEDDFSLDDCYTYMLKHDPYEARGIDKRQMQKANWYNLTPNKLTYAALDVFYMPALFHVCKDYHDCTPYKLDKLATGYAWEFQTNGLPFSEARIDELMQANNNKIAEYNIPINVNSWRQVRPYIGEDQSDGLALATFALEGNDRARDVQIVRKLIKLNSFLTKFKREATQGRIYGKFGFTTRSGRGNCKDQNLQQLPRATKGVFEAPDNHVLVMSDYAQLELRFICAVSSDKGMEKAFKDGVDLHQFTADVMGVPRQQAKTCNFNLTYGGSANMLRSIFIKEAGMLLPIQKVRYLTKQWHNLWTGLTKWQEQRTKEWRGGTSQYTVLGRRFNPNMYTDAMNLPIQGGSAEVAKLAMHYMFKAVKAEPILSSCKFVNFVHDSFMWECPDDEKAYTVLSNIIADSMLDAWKEVVQHTLVPDLPMPVDVIVGKNWGDLEKGAEEPKLVIKLEGKV